MNNVQRAFKKVCAAASPRCCCNRSEPGAATTIAPTLAQVPMAGIEPSQAERDVHLDDSGSMYPTSV
jgi:hypothetical protein